MDDQYGKELSVDRIDQMKKETKELIYENGALKRELKETVKLIKQYQENEQNNEN